MCFGVAVAANEACLYEALPRLPLGMAVTLEFLGPIAVALTASRGARQLLCALVALSGVALMSLTKLAASPLGVGFALAAAAGWAAYVLFSERAGRDQRPQDSLAISLVVSALLTVPLTVTHVPA